MLPNGAFKYFFRAHNHFILMSIQKTGKHEKKDKEKIMLDFRINKCKESKIMFGISIIFAFIK